MCRRVSFAIVLGRIRGVQAGRGFDGPQCRDERTESLATGAQRHSVPVLGQTEVVQRTAPVKKAREPDSSQCGRHELAVWHGSWPGELQTHFVVAVVAAAVVAVPAAGAVCRGSGHEGPAWRDPSLHMPLGGSVKSASLLKRGRVDVATLELGKSN
jgi:hypothetical protein